MPVISDQEYARLKGREQVADFVEPIYNSKELGSEARALIKKAYPNLQIEGYDLKQELQGQIAQVRNEIQETERARKDGEEREKFNRVRQETKDKHKFTDDAMDRLEKLMIERNIGDYEAGALLLATKEPKPMESTHGTSRFWEHEKQDGFAEISKDPEKWGYNQILGAARRDFERARSQGF